ncbi:MAG TPA: dehydrogenase [Planctomycetaceae bacterium]|nr:dehydrogenase [Planctomycetaceae bacterium]
MKANQSLSVPRLVRVKSGAINRIGIYLAREGLERVAVFKSEGLPTDITTKLYRGLASESIDVVSDAEVASGSFENAIDLFHSLPPGTQALLGIGGGKAIDVAKYAAFLAGLPFYAAPTSLSNDGFASPQSSLTVRERRRSLASRMPSAVIVDIAVCQTAPTVLWHSGVGDLVAKLTAVADWKLAYHHDRTPVNDFAALLSDATVMQFLANPVRNEEGLKTFAMALLLNGVSMEIAGTSRPASGSEHLISHALDGILSPPRLHGLQVGLASYVVAHLQRNTFVPRIAELFDRTGFWESAKAYPISLADFLAAVERAPTIKSNFHTILDQTDAPREVERLVSRDSRLRDCLIG